MGLSIYYFEKTMTSLEYICTTEAAINDIIHQNFESATIIIPEGMNITMINEYFQKLRNSCLQTLNKDSIIMIQRTNHLLLFGMIDSVKRVIDEHEKVKLTHDITQMELKFQDYEVCSKS